MASAQRTRSVVAVEKALWHFDSVILTKPLEIKKKVMDRLGELIVRHD